jgi:hypothetical protein
MACAASSQEAWPPRPAGACTFTIAPVLPILNIAAYLFSAIEDPAALRLDLCRRTARRPALRHPRHQGKLVGLAALPPDAGEGQARDHPHGPARRSSPQDGRAPAVDAAHAKRWLDQGHDDNGRPVVTLDTRNAFEVDHGSFEGAIDWRLGKFSEFPRRCCAHKRRTRRQDGGELLHRRHPLREGGASCARRGAGQRLAAGRRHPQILRGDRRRALSRRSASCSTERRTLAPDLSATGNAASARAAEDPDLARKA